MQDIKGHMEASGKKENFEIKSLKQQLQEAEKKILALKEELERAKSEEDMTMIAHIKGTLI